VAEHEAAERPEQKADAERREGGERAHRRADLREEFGVEDERGDDAVQQKVVPVDHGADEAAERRFACPAARRAVVGMAVFGALGWWYS
jgi:hypothetical protein